MKTRHLVLVGAALILGLTACDQSAPAESVADSKPMSEDVPPVEFGVEGRFTLVAGVIEDRDGTKHSTMLRIDSASGRTWQLNWEPQVVEEKPGVLVKMTNADGSDFLQHGWTLVNEPLERIIRLPDGQTKIKAVK